MSPLNSRLRSVILRPFLHRVRRNRVPGRRLSPPFRTVASLFQRHPRCLLLHPYIRPSFPRPLLRLSLLPRLAPASLPASSTPPGFVRSPFRAAGHKAFRPHRLLPTSPHPSNSLLLCPRRCRAIPCRPHPSHHPCKASERCLNRERSRQRPSHRPSQCSLARNPQRCPCRAACHHSRECFLPRPCRPLLSSRP